MKKVSAQFKLQIALLITVLFLFVSVNLTAQITEKEKNKAEKKAIKQAKKQEKIDKGKFMFMPVGAPAYTPEMGGLFAVGGLASFKTNPSDSLIQRSSFPFTIGYTTTGAIVANGILTSYWLKDKIRIFGDFWFKNMPDHYWGIGYENGLNTLQSDSTTAFQRKWWWINPRILFQFKEYYFVGTNIDINYTQGSEASQGVASDQTYLKYLDKPLNTGLGLILRYDSRDIPVDAWEGIYLDLSATFYGSYIGGDNSYQLYQLDYRQYQTIERKGKVLAWQIRGRFTEGDVPYGEMSQLGTPFDLRGYTWGRFRDKSMLFFLAEYRHRFLKKNSNELSPHSVVGWIGTGSVFDVNTTADNNLKWLPNFGVGYRIEVQPRMNIRVDIGIGKETSGFYFNFNQAF